MSRASRASGALLVLALHVAFVCLIQLEAWWGLAGTRPPLAATMLGQPGTLLVGGALGALFLVWPRGVVARAAYVAIITVTNLYLAIDPIAYRFFGDHLRPSLYEGSISTAGGISASVMAGVDRWVILNLALAAVAAAALYHRLGRAESPAPGRRTWAATLLMLAVAGAVGAFAPRDASLGRDPFVTLARDLVGLDRAAPNAVATETRIFDLRFGRYREDAAETARLRASFSALRAIPRPPNVLFVILESVGARAVSRLLDGPDGARLAPTLKSLAEHGALFDTVYDVFPSTLRTHVPLATGGPTVTWGSILDQTARPYRGPTMVGAFRRAGYRTALFSAGRLDVENLGRFYEGLGYDRLFDFATAPADFARASRVSSYGGDEDAVRGLATAWLDEGQAPFWMQFLTISSHHPYDTPASFVHPVPGDEPRAKYESAIAYTDLVLGRLVDDLRKRGVLDRTLIVVTGDHGEAFGDLHPGNVVHKRALYDENVRTFLLVSAPGAAVPPSRSHRIGTVGDVMPTILAAAGLPPEDVLGQDLFADAYAPRIVYFHKNAHPAAWGLRDGAWKFIARIAGEKSPELYDLESDPDELRNVASAHPDRVELYDRLCASWTMATEAELVRRLGGAPTLEEDAGVKVADLRAPGLKLAAVGAERDDGTFVPRDAVHPLEKIVLWTRWVPFDKERPLRFEWIAPSGRRFVGQASLGDEVIRLVAPLQDPLPHEPGTWNVAVYDAAGSAPLATRSFRVTGEAAPTTPVAERIPALTRLEVGPAPAADDAGVRSSDAGRRALHAGERLVVTTRGARRMHPYRVWCGFRAQSGAESWVPDVYFGANGAWAGCATTASERGTLHVRVMTFERDAELGAADAVIE